MVMENILFLIKTSEVVIHKGNEQENELLKINQSWDVTLYIQKTWLSEEERRVDALALRADERRDKLRKASGRSKYP